MSFRLSSISYRTRLQLRHGVKVGIAAVVATIASTLCGFEFVYWSSLTSVIVMQLTIADSIKMCWYRFSGTFLGALIAAGLILITPPTFEWHLVSFFFGSAFCAFMTRYNPRYKMAAITLTIIFMGSMGHPERLNFAFFRVLEISVGVLSAFAVSLLIWPVSGVDKLRNDVKEELQLFTTAYCRIVDSFMVGSVTLSDDFLNDVEDKLYQNRQQNRSIIRHETLFFHKELKELSILVHGVRLLAEDIQTMLRILQTGDQRCSTVLLLERELRDLAGKSATVMLDLGTHVKDVDRRALLMALSTLESKLIELRHREVTHPLDVRMMTQFFSLYQIMFHFGETLFTLSGDLEEARKNKAHRRMLKAWSRQKH